MFRNSPAQVSLVWGNVPGIPAALPPKTAPHTLLRETEKQVVSSLGSQRPEIVLGKFEALVVRV